MVNLTSLLKYADIDLVTFEEGVYELEFYIFETKDKHTVYGSDVEAVIDEALSKVMHELTLSDLRREGLTDADIDRIVDSRELELEFERADDEWNRGYDAGVSDTVRNQSIAQQALAAATSAPAMAAVGEPIDAPTVGQQALARYPLMYVIYQPVAIVQSDI